MVSGTQGIDNLSLAEACGAKKVSVAPVRNLQVCQLQNQGKKRLEALKTSIFWICSGFGGSLLLQTY